MQTARALADSLLAVHGLRAYEALAERSFDALVARGAQLSDVERDAGRILRVECLEEDDAEYFERIGAPI